MKYNRGTSKIWVLGGICKYNKQYIQNMQKYAKKIIPFIFMYDANRLNYYQNSSDVAKDKKTLI